MLVQYVHVNKQKKCWTVHNSRGCFHFDEVEIRVPVKTVYKPEKKDNPRFFLRCKGSLIFTDNKAIIE
jgi:hypothetical protein